MIKRWSKKGQFYLIAAIAIIAVIITLNASINYSTRRTSIEIDNLKEELEIESEKVIDYAVTNNINKNLLLDNFTKLFDSYAGKDTEIYFITGEYLLNGTHTMNTFTYNSTGKEYQPTVVGTQSNELIMLDKEGQANYFYLNEGTNFFFVIKKNIGGEMYVVTNQYKNILGGSSLDNNSSLPFINATQFLNSRGIVSWWRFEDMGNKVVDQTGRNNGSHSGLTTSAVGKFGKAFYFDGFDDFVNIPHSSSLDITENITISLWYNTSQNPPQKTALICKTKQHSNAFYEGGYGFTYWGTVLRFFVNDSNQNFAQSSTFPTDNQWHHIVGVFDGINLKIYMDNNPSSTTSSIQTFSSSLNNLYIGAGVDNSGVPDKFMNATIDEVMIFNKTLNDSDVGMLYGLNLSNV